MFESESEPEVDPKPSHGFFIVGVGASAGGLEAIEVLFDHISPASPAAYIVVQHLSPDFKSLMDQLLARHTELPIHRAEEGMRVESRNVYLIPPRKDMRIVDGCLRLSEQQKDRSPPLPIDVFFRSLAEDAGENGIGIVLSGTGSDGSRGIQEIKRAGGVVIAQDRESARFDGMPAAAIATGMVDAVLSPEVIGRKIEAYMGAQLQGILPDPDIQEGAFAEILALLRREHGVDLSQYKDRTLRRRLKRRMGIVQAKTLDDYRDALLTDRAESERLLNDVLIGVTEFFRDREAFEAIEGELKRISDLAGDDPIRIWVAGCSTGEEVYTLAMLLDELQKEVGDHRDFKIFGTDLNPRAIARASEGKFPFGIAENLNAQRLERYFEETSEGYKVSRRLRDRVVFAVHDVSTDPPFTRIHLATCRNLLIYLMPEVQARVLRYLHFSLVRDGVLCLGPSETLGVLENDFDSVNSKWNVFRKVRDARLALDPETLEPRNFRAAPSPLLGAAAPSGAVADRIDLERVCGAFLNLYTPACVVLDEQGIVTHTFGDVSSYLGIPQGRATLDFLRMLDSEARVAVATAMHRARKANTDVRYDSVRFVVGEKKISTDLTVKFLPRLKESHQSDLYLILLGQPRANEATDLGLEDEVGGRSTLRIQQLEEELQATKESLQATIEELETTNEELQSTNEELLASNEELQSTNEELHSVNEELYTVNAEHHKKIEELTELSGDVENLLRSTGVGTVFLDASLNIRKFTPQAADVISILASDIGRPIQHLATSVSGVNLHEAASEVMASGVPVEHETIDQHRVPRLIRFLPYQVGGVQEGVVMTFVDVSMVKDAQRSLAETEERFRGMLEHLDQVFWMLEPATRNFTYASPLFEEYWGLPTSRLYERPASWLDPIHMDDRAAARAFFDDPDCDVTTEITCRLVSGNGAIRWIQVKRSPVRNTEGELVGIAGSALDMTADRERADSLSKLASDLEEKALRDALTGLANRRGLDRILSRELERSRRSGMQLAVILADIDDFKAVNDKLGHAAGDVVLEGMAGRMAEVLRPTDGLARVGGDEFLAVLPDTRLTEATQVAERLRLAVADNPIFLDGKPFVATASLGVGMIPGHTVSIEEVLNVTRAALRDGKKNGKNCVVAATDSAGTRSSFGTATDGFEEFLNNREVETFIQDIRSVNDGRTIGHELLSRGPEGPYRRPSDLFRLSDENNSLVVVDLLCFNACLEAAKKIKTKLPIHINLFPSTLLDTSVERILDLMKTAGDPHQFCIELSERQFLGAPSNLAERVRQLRDAGVSVALDDIGFGRSSLEALVILEPDTVKIAREYIWNVDKDAGRRADLGRLLKALRALTSRIIAEGVETKAEAKVLVDLDIEMAQGFLWDRPRRLN